MIDPMTFPELSQEYLPEGDATPAQRRQFWLRQLMLPGLWYRRQAAEVILRVMGVLD